MATISKLDKKKIADKVLPKKEDVTYTKKFTESKKKIDANVKSGALSKSGVVSSDNKATVKPYEKKFIPAGKGNTYAKVVDSKGSLVKSADNKVGAKTSNERLYAEFKRDSTDTMNRRKANLNFVDVNIGNKKDLTAKDLQSLRDLRKIKKAKK